MVFMKETGENQFRNKITVLTFCTIILVIFGHTYNVEVYGLRERTDLLSVVVKEFEFWFRRVQGDFCNGFMFIVSGYLFYNSFTWKKLSEKYKSRFRSLVIPYIFWCSFYFIYFCIITRIPVISSMINEGVPVEFSALNWIKWLTVDKYYVLWFLQELIIMVICAPIIYVLMKNQFKLPTGLFILIFLFLVELKIINVPFMCFDVHYLLGAYIGINYKKLPRMEGKAIRYTARIVFALLLVWEWICAKKGIPNNPNNPVIQVLMYGSVWFSLDERLFDKKLKWWLYISFFIYSIHDFYLEAFERLFYIIFGSHSIFALLDYLFMPFVVAGGSILTAAILKKLFPRLWGIITGSRG